MIYLVILIAAVLLVGAAAVRKTILALMGGAVLAASVAYLAVAREWPMWLLVTTVGGPLVALLAFEAVNQIVDRRRLNQRIKEIEKEKSKYTV